VTCHTCRMIGRPGIIYEKRGVRLALASLKVTLELPLYTSQMLIMHPALGGLELPHLSRSLLIAKSYFNQPAGTFIGLLRPTFVAGPEHLPPHYCLFMLNLPPRPSNGCVCSSMTRNKLIGWLSVVIEVQESAVVHYRLDHTHRYSKKRWGYSRLGVISIT
jgi:hypothetical protein